ncbi:hypothetical protein HY945_03140 [Candidatus Gottesmanbacteria bacterium]|nr:hypothetical protein [Candidatus Gottesmanbacteria bacterium]
MLREKLFRFKRFDWSLAMFFFQDDIGLLIQLQTIPFWQFLITPQAEHFAPVLHLLSSLEYRLFHLNFISYVAVVILIHLLNCVVLGKIVYVLFHSRFFSLIAVSFFAINLTYTEPFLWFSANGVVLATLFLGLSFYSWYKFITGDKLSYFWGSVVFVLLSGFSFGVGVALGLVFAFVTFICKEKINKRYFSKAAIVYIVIGLFSYLIGPIIAQNKLDRVVPLIADPIKDVILYLSFIIAGVARGVVGRFFLPGFEPRHFQIIPTIISFLPFILICFLIFWLLKAKIRRQYKLLLVTLSVFIFYPYVWSGFLRSHFGLKQALAERYVYPSLFFFSIFLVMLIKQLMDRGFIRSKKLIVVFALSIVIIQSLLFIRNTILFEERPLKTKDYFDKLQTVLRKSTAVLDLPLPSFINQEYKISQLAILPDFSKVRFVSPNYTFCTAEFIKEFEKKEISSFYKEQTQDPVIIKVFSEDLLNRCLTKFKGSV